MKRTLLTIAAVSFLLLAGCEKNNVAPKQDSTSIKSKAVNGVNKGSKDTIWIAKPATTPSVRKDTIWNQ